MAVVKKIYNVAKRVTHLLQFLCDVPELAETFPKIVAYGSRKKAKQELSEVATAPCHMPPSRG